jgi:hypothetical protein
MNKYDHLKEKAIKLRENGYSLPDICKRLNKGKSTVHYWIKNTTIKKMNIFLKRTAFKVKKCCIEAGKASRRKYAKVHEEYKNVALKLWEEELKNNNDFKLFLIYYACEGDRKTKWAVGLCNSDPSLIQYCLLWFKKLNVRNKPILYNVQLHIDQDEKEIKNYWINLLNINEIKTIRKSNSGKMSGRNWNSKYGVLSVRFYDAYIKTMIDAWIVLIKDEIVHKQFQFDLKIKDLPIIPNHSSYSKIYHTRNPSGSQENESNDSDHFCSL